MNLSDFNKAREGNAEFLAQKAMCRKREELQGIDEKQQKELDKEELANIIAAKIRTSFIGALAAFEAEFGYIWGHGQLRVTPEQNTMKERWAKVRKTILDKGNDQIKFARNEVAKYEVDKVGIRTEVDLDKYFESFYSGGTNG